MFLSLGATDPPELEAPLAKVPRIGDTLTLAPRAPQTLLGTWLLLSEEKEQLERRAREVTLILAAMQQQLFEGASPIDLFNNLVRFHRVLLLCLPFWPIRGPPSSLFLSVRSVMLLFSLSVSALVTTQ